MSEPLLTLPKDLQDRRRELRQQRQLIDDELKSIDDQIKSRRAKCEHEQPSGLTGYEYAVYCAKCGLMIDSWL